MYWPWALAATCRAGLAASFGARDLERLHERQNLVGRWLKEPRPLKLEVRRIVDAFGRDKQLLDQRERAVLAVLVAEVHHQVIAVLVEILYSAARQPTDP
jgi:hypothetical protein